MSIVRGARTNRNLARSSTPRPLLYAVDVASHPRHLLTLDPRQLGPHVVLLDSGGILEGTVLDPMGRPVPGARITVVPPGWPPQRYVAEYVLLACGTDEKGRFRMRLRAGTHRVRAYSPRGLERAETEVQVRTGGTTHQEIRLLPANG